MQKFCLCKSKVSIFNNYLHFNPGSSARRKWTLMRLKSNAHGVFSEQNYRMYVSDRAHQSLDNVLILVWLEVTFVWNDLITGEFKRILVWSENSLVQLGLRRNHFKRFFFNFLLRDSSALDSDQRHLESTWVWSEAISSSLGSDQKNFWMHMGLIWGDFNHTWD